ncbi:DEAD/DEAH box helicase family protein [Clostridium botulinum]|uniref:DEAD/DEAH box helicase family protein n=1 Tax=Clostridium botulinum TaxID=1491 RepID=UPI001C9B0572|nr:DEAD/DEAH box helicase family protein [Clostridium botulinum]MBY6809009.1 DNA helicase [Clostridium botulinum]MBY6822286.1 DNA helicase [Clostridium botulinum]MBY6832924.1 DNA helicase [Clostridium botulinum]MBY6972152.1 DNA helicase [Clostridium botulinum]HBJ1649387.1 DNA helicase [Clostridium botulinum]
MIKQRVTDLIKYDNIRKWNRNDIITIKAGTGVGKSYFIKNQLYSFAKLYNKKILFLIHRTNCTNQFYEEIKRDNKTDVIDIRTYQAIETIVKNKGVFDFTPYQYIVCDEFQYFVSDSSWNVTTDISLNKILEQNATKIFMSATGDDSKRYINNVKKLETIDYEILITYDFIKELNFFNTDETLERFIEYLDGTGEKAIFFIQSAAKAYKLYTKFKDKCLFNCSTSNDKYYKYVDTDKIDNMLKNESFKEQILITTTCMDAGVNINDEKVKHIICDVKDIGTLIQCMGRKRIQNENDGIYLYIKTITNEQLGGMETQTKKKIEKAEFLRTHTVKEYIEEYPRDYDYNKIVYDEVIDDENNCTKKINELMVFKCKMDIMDIEIMKTYEKFGYCKYLATKFGFRDDNGYYNYRVIEEEDSKAKLERHLSDMVGKVMLQVKDRKELIEMIDVKSNGHLLKKINNLNGALEEREIPYRIVEFSTSKMINGKQKRYPSAWKVEKLVG